MNRVFCIVPIVAASLLWLATATGCSQRQPRSSWRIIEEGERNPIITTSPARAGEIKQRH